MKQRLTALFLSLALLTALAVPAAAAEDPYDTGYDAGYAVGHQAGYTEGYGDYVPMDETSDSDYSYYDNYYDNYSFDQSPQYADGYETYDDGYQDGYCNGYYDGYSDGWEKASNSAEVVAIGGTAGQVNVMLNGTCISFPDAVPQVKSQRVMVPLRAVLEAMGGQAEYLGDGQVSCTIGETDLSLTIGGTTVTAVKDGVSTTLQMDCASYASGSRTYVPVRFFSEAAGYDVYWDGDYDCVVVLDQDALISQIDEHFSTVNRLVQLQMTALAGYHTITSSFTATAEIVDSINGNQTYTANGSYTAHTDGMAMELTGSADLSELADLITGTSELTGEALMEAAALKSQLSNVTFAIKITEDGAYYLQCPLFNELVLGTDGNSDAWCKVADLNDSGISMDEGFTMGSLLYASVTGGYSAPFQYYSDLKTADSSVESILGDDCFTNSGSTTYRWHFGIDELCEAMELDEADRADLESYLQDLDLNLSFTDYGSYSMDGVVQVSVDTLGALLKLELAENGTFSSGGQASLSVQVRNLFNLNLTTNTTIKSSSQAPDLSLPEGAEVIDLTDPDSWY